MDIGASERQLILKTLVGNYFADENSEEEGEMVIIINKVKLTLSVHEGIFSL